MNGLKDINQTEQEFFIAEDDSLDPIDYEPDIFTVCSECGDFIYYGCYYYVINAEDFCEACTKKLFLHLAAGY